VLYEFVENFTAFLAVAKLQLVKPRGFLGTQCIDH